MGLFDFLWRLLGGTPRGLQPAEQPVGQAASFAEALTSVEPRSSSLADPEDPPEQVFSPGSPKQLPVASVRHREGPRKRISIESLEYQSSLIPTPPAHEIVHRRPYRFASISTRPGNYLDLSQDVDQRWLEYYGLPTLKTPDDLADWLGISIGKLAWLTHRTTPHQRPETERKSHYAYRWLEKRSGGWRLIEAPKMELKLAQQQILREILDLVPAHPAAHGFVAGRSILTNAAPHVRQRFLLKLDLKDFYATVRYSRVVAIFRSFGYSREVAIWLARLTTSTIPWNLKSPLNAVELSRFSARHLPQGGVTSPALANLSAFSLDVRLSGLARSYRLRYSRYADDLTFSGPGKAVPALHEIITLVRKVIRSERFYVNPRKCRVLRNGQRQSVTGIIVNDRINISRTEYDLLKATLYNCIQHGPASQNRDGHPHFEEHLRGRLAHALNVNPARAQKLLDLFDRINWTK